MRIILVKSMMVTMVACAGASRVAGDAGAPDSRARLVVLATTVAPPWTGFGNEDDDVIHSTGLAPQPVATETATQTTVRSFFE